MSNSRFRFTWLAVATTVLCASGLAQWSPLQNISRDTTGNVKAQSLAIDSFHTLHACWTHQMDGYEDDWIEYSCKPANVDTWTIPVRINPHLMYFLGSVVAIGPSQVPYVIWRSQTDSDFTYVSQRSGDTWITVHQPGWCGFAQALRAATDRLGRLHLTWGDYGRAIWYARLEASGWTRPETAACFQTHGVGYSDIAADRQGYAHIVYETFHDTAGYVHQTPTGWSAPEGLSSGTDGGGRNPRVCVDTLDEPQVAWFDYMITTFSGKQGGVWSPPVRLDSPLVKGGFQPSLCVDRWNQVHVFFGDDDENGHSFGMRERVKCGWRWTEDREIDTIAGWAEVVADGTRLHLLHRRQVFDNAHVWYSYRDMDPPAVEEINVAHASAGPRVSDLATPLTEIPYILNQPGKIQITILDCAGRRTWTSDTQVKGPGCYTFLPYSHLPGSGVFYCRITAGSSGRIVKLVRID